MSNVIVSILKAFWVPIAFWAFRNGMSFYRQTKAAYQSNLVRVRPLPPHVSRMLNLLAVFILYLLATTLSSPENIFKLTNARLQTSTDVIFSRLAALRPLTPHDDALKSRLLSRESRLIYMAFGPRALTDCLVCDTGAPRTFAVYALPTVLGPHLLNALVLGLVSSSAAGPEGSRWRPAAATLALALAALDVAALFGYDVTRNGLGLRTADYDFFFWRARVLRPLAIAAADALFGWVVYVSATNRLFVQTPTPVQRLDAIAQAVDANNQRLWAVGAVRGAAAREPELRARVETYLERERDVLEDREVVGAMASARARVDMRQLEGAAERKAEEIVAALESRGFNAGAAG